MSFFHIYIETKFQHLMIHINKERKKKKKKRK